MHDNRDAEAEMNCPSCGRLLFPTQRTCACGWVNKSPARKPELREQNPPSEGTPNAARRKFYSTLHEVTAYVEKYQFAHPGSKKRDACMAFMREKGLIDYLPTHIREQADREAQAERAAIQDESRA